MVTPNIKMKPANIDRSKGIPCIIIKAGATVKRLDYNGRTAEDVIIEDGAVIGEIVNLAE